MLHILLGYHIPAVGRQINNGRGPVQSLADGGTALSSLHSLGTEPLQRHLTATSSPTIANGSLPGIPAEEALKKNIGRLNENDNRWCSSWYSLEVKGK